MLPKGYIIMYQFLKPSADFLQVLTACFAEYVWTYWDGIIYLHEITYQAIPTVSQALNTTVSPKHFYQDEEILLY